MAYETSKPAYIEYDPEMTVEGFEAGYPGDTTRKLTEYQAKFLKQAQPRAWFLDSDGTLHAKIWDPIRLEYSIASRSASIKAPLHPMVAAERERCAKIAEGEGNGPDWDITGSSMAERIAAKIRSGE